MVDDIESTLPHAVLCGHGQLKRQCQLCEKDDLIRSQANIIDAYEKSMTAIREALGLSEFDDHELVIDEIKLKNALLATQAERIAELEAMLSPDARHPMSSGK